MNAPNVLLKKLKLFDGHEGQGFSTEVWINGVNCMHSIDDGNGGCYMHHQNFEHKDQKLVAANIKLLNDWIKEQPKVKYADFNLEFDMDMFIDNLINKIELEKEEKRHKRRLLRLQETAFLCGVPNEDKFNRTQFKVPLSKIPKDILQTKYNTFKQTFLKGNVVCFNTNLEALGIKL